MSAFATAYVLVLTGVILYVVRLAAHQRRLVRSIEELRSELRQRKRAGHGEVPVSRAA